MQFLNSLNDVLWTYIVVVILVGCALYFTIRLKGVQFTMIPEMLRLMLGKDRKEKTGIGSFEAFSVSLASRVGTGNLAGVASAIFVGGPGAVFWMWVMAFLGAATAFIEATLAQLYKRRGRDSYYGGPAYYMQYGLHSKWLGIIFSVLLILSFGLAQQMVQSNTIVESLNDSFGWNKALTAIILAAVLLVIIFGGIRRITRTLSFAVPFMAMGFILLTLAVIAMNITKVPEVLRLIVDSAFGIRQVGGALVGTAILQGVRRGLFSNEAGEGSTPNAAAIAETSHPAKQGLIQSLGVYIDTIVICTCTAFIIIIAGLYDTGADGIVLTMRSLEAEIGPVGRYFLNAAIFLFAYSTIIANYYYAETNIRFITGKKVYVWAFRILTGAIAVTGAFLSLEQIWCIVDISMGLLVICNVTSILLLSPKAIWLLKDYRAQKKKGLEPEFHRAEMPSCEGDIECWE